MGRLIGLFALLGLTLGADVFHQQTYMKNVQTIIRDANTSAHVMVSDEADTMQRVLVAFPALNSGSFLQLVPLSDPAAEIKLLEPLSSPLTFQYGTFNGVEFEVALLAPARLEESIFGSIRIIRDYVEGGGTVWKRGPDDFTYRMLRNDGERVLPSDSGLNDVTFVRTFFHELDEVRLTISSSDVTFNILEPNVDNTLDVPFNTGLYHMSLIPTDVTRPGTLKIRTGINVAPPAPMSPTDIFWTRTILDSPLIDQFAFLSIEEGWLTGSWRFLTYFGRDTLLTLFLLFDDLSPAMIENVLEAALSRVSMSRDAMEEWPSWWDRETDTTGFVCHEDEVGDFANWNGGINPNRTDRLVKCDYKHADSDFLILPVLAKFAEREPARTHALLNKRSTIPLNENMQLQQMLEANALAVLRQTAPYYFSPEYYNLVKIRHVTVGNWRDSNEGLAYTLYPVDINTAFVPAALKAISRLASLNFLPSAFGVDAENKNAVWSAHSLHHFTYSVATSGVYGRLQGYIRDGSGCFHCWPMMGSSSDLTYMESFLGVGIHENGTVAPLLNSDYGFLLAFRDDVPDRFVREAALATRLQFPRGLHTDAGLLTANPAYMWNSSPDGPFNAIATELGRNGYHGAVIWGWQSIMMSYGLSNYINRESISIETRGEIRRATERLWEGIQNGLEAQGAAEMWTFDYNSTTGDTVAIDFSSEGTEGNMVQLWSFTVLGHELPLFESVLKSYWIGVVGALTLPLLIE